ncbi:MAG: pentapeptide repeat-containing protein, partial [Geitlerinemataceae cyanobacterium]
IEESSTASPATVRVSSPIPETPAVTQVEETPTLLVSELPVELLEQSFEKIKPHAEEFVASFYENLFQANPELKRLFANTEMTIQHKKLLQSLILVVENLRNPEALGAVLENLGARHVGYGTVPKQYGAVGAALLLTFEQYLQDDWTPEVKKAWHNAFTAITKKMLKGASAYSAPTVVEVNKSTSLPKTVNVEQKPETLDKPSTLNTETQKEDPVFQTIEEPKKKALISIQLDDRIFKDTIDYFIVKSQKIQTQISENALSEVLKNIPRLLVNRFWELPTWVVATSSAIIMVAVFLVTDDNSLFSEVLGGIDAISMVVALVLFIKEAPDRRKQFHYQAWSIIDAAHGVKVSYARILAMQDLNEDSISLRGLDVPGAEFINIHLPSSNLSAANLTEADFSNANLSHANLDKAHLCRAKLSGANLERATLSFTNMSYVNLSNANLNSANLICSDLSHANMAGANLRNATLSGANLSEAYLNGANLKGAQVSISDLKDAVLEGAIMPDGLKYKSLKN